MRGVPGNRHSYRDYLLTLLDPSTIFRSYGAGRIYGILRILLLYLNFPPARHLPAMLRNLPASARRWQAGARQAGCSRAGPPSCQAERGGRARQAGKELKIPNRYAKGGKGQRSDVGSQGSEKDSGLKYLGMNAFGKDRNFIG